MKSFNGGKFGLTVQSSGKGAAKRSIDPEVFITPTSGQIKINDATSRLLQIGNRENAVIIGNRRELEDYRDSNPEEFEAYLVETAEEMVAAGDLDEGSALTIDDVTIWGIAKGWGLFSKNGSPIMVADRLTKEEKAQCELDDEGKAIIEPVQSLSGFRVASNGNQTGVGHIMTGNDTANYAFLGGNKNENIVYAVTRTPEVVPMPNGAENVDIKVYMMEKVRTEGKLRNAAKTENVDVTGSTDAPDLNE